jgi:hypothetical protein
MIQILTMSRREKSYMQNYMNATGEVLEYDGIVYKTAKAFVMPRSTLKYWLQIPATQEKIPSLNAGRPFHSIAAQELKTVSYINKMQ